MIRILIAAAVAMTVSLLGTHLLIRALTHYRIGQPIRDDGPEGHNTKAGTPTMGGLAVVSGAVLGYVISDFYNGIYTTSGIFVMLAIVGGGAVGLLDDWIKVVRERNLGLNKRAKIFGLLAVGLIFAVLMVEHTPTHSVVSFTRFNQPGIQIGSVLWVIWAVILIVGSSNAVNLTDGLDGLAAGAGVFTFGAFTVVAFWQFRLPEIYEVRHALDLAVVAAAMAGGCLGFLWWNAAPARIFMGDTGSLAIGSGLAALALATSTTLLLPIVAGLFVFETISVMVQVAGFRMFGGRRVFRMAPIHHHFELRGWPETTVIVRFWILAGVCTAAGLGLFYADSINVGLTDGMGASTP
ncbi:MAG: phospho-N-acetylmuramoyl-pentapeptide-transferase [Acidimicrobiaceae bacterium]|nr:phospho-N-acetylmuramoyl-pentapeptide-transferase [Acidimicrobiaceae bacterium]HJO80525.1 phospho-N-acetylmuramoyl-pentapeptide-transferase [Acidimicrobiales bacterium]|tara:strand:- start:11133 stop:12188 length:1056 start_codon:yes stop_codon:yes gene_type:complete